MYLKNRLALSSADRAIIVLNEHIDISADTEDTNSQSSERGPCVSRKTTFWKEATQLHSEILSNVAQSTGSYCGALLDLQYYSRRSAILSPNTSNGTKLVDPQY